MKQIAIVASCLLAGFHLWTGLDGVFESFLQRNIHLLLVLAAAAAFILGDRSAGTARSRIVMVLASTVLVSQGSLRQFPLSQFPQLFPERFRRCAPTKALSWRAVEAVTNRLHIAI
ncbi:hypothetical protein [Sulfitobacter sp. HI0076]|uniref:hypothetical protein n=1 Tax=Sulfitobacter sp. HI0076 TaxID=1822251 RepID=UPI00191BA2E4|nr:hypothetical protein [Sulfitobacter sp. HI0076]